MMPCMNKCMFVCRWRGWFIRVHQFWLRCSPKKRSRCGCSNLKAVAGQDRLLLPPLTWISCFVKPVYYYLIPLLLLLHLFYSGWQIHIHRALGASPYSLSQPQNLQLSIAVSIRNRMHEDHNIQSRPCLQYLIVMPTLTMISCSCYRDCFQPCCGTWISTTDICTTRIR